MKKTKIICSIGPSSLEGTNLVNMVESGMNVARINLSHGNYEEYSQIVKSVYKAHKKTGKKISIMYDTKGPEFRLGKVENGNIKLESGQNIDLVFEKTIGTKEKLSCNHPEILKKLKKEDILLIENGKLKFKVINTHFDHLTCNIITGGDLSNHKSITVIGTPIHIPYLSDIDKEDLKFALENHADFLALSFVSCIDDINLVKDYIRQFDKNVKIICKIENKEGVNNLSSILDNSDGIMVARGDLGTELDYSIIPIVQKEMIQKAREKNKIAIVATEMLESMIEEIRPTRAETSDVANAIIDGADSVMLSGETTVGKYPVETVKAMNQICIETENWVKFDYSSHLSINDLNYSIPINVVNTANHLNAKLIVTATLSGQTAEYISNLKPKAPILALCPNKETEKSLTLNYGIYTNSIPIIKSSDKLTLRMIDEAHKFMQLNKGDIIILTASFPSTGETSFTNIMEIEIIK